MKTTEEDKFKIQHNEKITCKHANFMTANYTKHCLHIAQYTFAVLQCTVVCPIQYFDDKTL